MQKPVASWKHTHHPISGDEGLGYQATRKYTVWRLQCCAYAKSVQGSVQGVRRIAGLPIRDDAWPYHYTEKIMLECMGLRVSKTRAPISDSNLLAPLMWDVHCGVVRVHDPESYSGFRPSSPWPANDGDLQYEHGLMKPNCLAGGLSTELHFGS